MRAHAEWKVMTHIARVRRPTSCSTGSRISAAALLVNVIARISPGCACPDRTRWAIRRVRTAVLPDPAPARMRSGPSPWRTASRWGSLRPSSRASAEASAGAGTAVLTPSRIEPRSARSRGRGGLGRRRLRGRAAGRAVGYREQAPLARYALERMRTALLEVDPGADDEFADGARDQDLAGAGERRHARADVHRHAGHVVAHDLDLAGVDARANLEPQLSGAVAGLARAPDRARRPVEGGEEAVPERLDLVTLECAQGLADDRVVRRDPIAPAAIPERGGAIRRAHDVGEEDRLQHPLRAVRAARAEQEVLDLIHERAYVADHRQVVSPGELDIARSRDVVGQVPTVGGGDHLVLGAMEDEGGNADRRQHAARVDLPVEVHELDAAPRARAPTQEPRPRVADRWVVHRARRPQLESRRAAPLLAQELAPAIEHRVGKAERVVGGAHEAGVGPVQDERPCAVGVRGREQRRHRAALGHAD